MHATSQPVLQQQRRVIAHRQKSQSADFFNILTSDALLERVDALLPEHRERLYPPTETLSLFLAQALNPDRSCQHIVNQAALQRAGSGLRTGSVATGAYCRARKRLPLNLLRQLTQDLNTLVEPLLPHAWRWRDRRVRIVDGTTLSMPDTPANQAAFPQSKGQRPGLGFPLCRMVGITCLSSGMVVNAALGPCKGRGSGEQSLLRSLYDTFSAGDVLLGDAFFATYFFLVAMRERCVDIVMEQQGARQRCTDFRRGRQQGVKDHLVVLCKPKIRPDWMSQEEYESSPSALTVRELKVGGKILVTTLLNAKEISKVDLKALYKNRWNVELDIRNIKETLGMGVLSCVNAHQELTQL